MPHLSKRKISNKVRNDIERQIDKFLTEISGKKRQRIFAELVTPTERMMLAKRLAMIFLLQKGKSINATSRALKVSPSTVNRFAVSLERKRFQTIVEWVKSEKAKRSVTGILGSLLAVPFDAQRKSLKQLLDEF